MRTRPFKPGFKSIKFFFVTLFILTLVLTLMQQTPLLAVNLRNHPIAAKILEHAKKTGVNASLFGGTARDILMNEAINEDDEYDILLPPDFIENELTLEQRDFIKSTEKITGGKNRCHFIYPQGRESFKKLYSIGGLSINKIVISSNLKIIDRNNGISDIRKKLLRHIPGADIYWPSFLPVFDVLRGIRFLSQYKGYNLDPMTSRYYRESVKKVMDDSILTHRILTIFKNISQGKQHSDNFPGTGKDFIRTKVQIRSIKKRLDKIFDCAIDPKKAELLLEKFNLKTYFKRLRWPEKDYIVAKMNPNRFNKPEKISPAALAVSNTQGNTSDNAFNDENNFYTDNNMQDSSGIDSQNYDTSSGTESSFERKMQNRFSDNDSNYSNDTDGTDDSTELADERFDVYKNDENTDATDQYNSPEQNEDNFVDPFEDIDFEDFDLEDF